MAKYMQLKINNTKGHSVNRGKWKDPGAKLYDQLLQAFYCIGGIPTDGKGMDKAVAEGKYKQWPDFLHEAYLVAPVKDIKNSPYRVTPYSRSGCKYPHHTIRNGELVVSIPGLKAAYDRAFRYDELHGPILRHLNRHMKELGLTHQWHHGQLYWNEQADSMGKIENNFNSIMGYLSESNDELKSAFIMEDKEIYNQQAEGLNSENYIRPLNKNDVTGSHFIDWFFKMDEFADDLPENFDYDILVHDSTMQNYCYGYFIDKKLEGIIRVRFNPTNNAYGVSMLFVNADNQHIGIGNSLMKHAVSLFGDHDMILRVFSFNTKALSLYQKYGFVKFQEDIYKDGPDSDPKFVGKTMYLMKRNAVHLVNDSDQITESANNDTLIQNELQLIESFVQGCQTEANGHIVASGDMAEYKITDDELKSVRKSDPKNVYDPPLKYEELPDHLKNDPIHSWRAKSGIELIHKEPTIEELDRIWKNWQLMSNEQKRISDEKSIELFGINNEDNYITLHKNYDKGVMESMDDDLDWIEKYIREEGEDPDAPPSLPEEKPEEESMPKKTDKAESSKNGVRRKNLYIEFIKWCKEYNPKNTFGSIFDKDAFNVTYPFIPDEMRYFYRLANPMLCVLAGSLTFFAAAELRKVNAKNSHLSEMMIFAGTAEEVRVFNCKDKKVYRAVEENGTLKLNEVLGDTFDTYIQKMIDKGDILNAPIEESTGLEVQI